PVGRQWDRWIAVQARCAHRMRRARGSSAKQRPGQEGGAAWWTRRAAKLDAKHLPIVNIEGVPAPKEKGGRSLARLDLSVERFRLEAAPVHVDVRADIEDASYRVARIGGRPDGRLVVEETVDPAMPPTPNGCR